MSKRVRIAAYLAHTRRADGSWPADWLIARMAMTDARRVLRKHLADIKLPHELTAVAHAASEDARLYISVSANWQQVQSQVLRVLPVVQRVLRTLAESEHLGKQPP